MLKSSVAAATASAVAAPMIIPGSALGKDGATAPSNRITIGFIGTGKQAQAHIGSLSGKSNTQVLAVCDVDTTRRMHSQKRIVDKYKKLERKGADSVAAYVEYEKVIARDDIDAVVIATPDHWHAIPILAACKAKKDIYCEKPLTLTIEEAKTVLDAVRKHNIVFQTGSQQRSNARFHKACEYVRNGRIGKIKEVHVNVGGPSKWCDLKEEKMEPGLEWNRWLGQAPTRPYSSVLSPRGMHRHYPAWRNYREFSGGMMTDWGAHHFDIAQWGLGMDQSGPVEIIPPEDLKKGKGVTYIYANGVPLIHKDAGKGVGIKFIGEDGSISVNRGMLTSDSKKILEEPLGDDAKRLYKSTNHHNDWLSCIKTRKRPICDVEIGARSVTVCHLGNLAYWHGKKMKWDPKNWKFTDDTPAAWLTRDRREGYELPKV